MAVTLDAGRFRFPFSSACVARGRWLARSTWECRGERQQAELPAGEGLDVHLLQQCSQGRDYAQVQQMIVSPTVVLSPTRVAGALKCLRKHVLSEVLGQHPNGEEAPALDFGDMMHRVAAVYWFEGLAVATEYLLQNFTKPFNDKHTPELAHKLLAVYARDAKLFPFGGDEWVIEDLEERYSVEVPFGTLTFQIDRLLRNQNTGALALVDLKTASRCDARWAKQWPRSLQMKLYSECCVRKYGQALQWLVIEGLDKTAAKVEYLALPEVSEEKRAEAWHSVEWIARHDAQLLDAARDAESGAINVDKLVELALTSTPTNESECFSYYRECDFLPLCDAEPSERIALLRGDYHWEQPKHLV
jgi:hypothetical protein